MPCLFRPEPGSASLPAQATDELRQLAKAAEQLLACDSPDWGVAVETIRAVLTAQRRLSQAAPADWSGAYFAAVAARACLAQGDRSRAKELLAVGSQFNADEPELQFLTRVLAREAGRGIAPVRQARVLE